ncbi:MAG: molybdopterin-guanine dinucleotide biosynthesis protein B [Eubacteriales bacterium]|nr:molybdopterin-guanine dinucleotide biosynthesis protein B [Eubacteriales bacterium]
MDKMTISLVVLCGGKSSRMGRDKSMLPVDGETMLERILGRLRTPGERVAVDDVVLSVGDASEPQRYEKITGVRSAYDESPGCGPLAGFEAALQACRHSTVFVTACDMPEVDMELVEELFFHVALGTEAVIPVDKQGKMYGLCGLFHKKAGGAAKRCLREGRYRVRDLLHELSVVKVPVERLMGGTHKLQNINTKKEYEHYVEAEAGFPIPVFSVVAYSGVGKTTFLERLIPELKKRGLRVAAVKHDAHQFTIDKEGKDSWRMTEAGADVTGLMSERRAVLMENRPVDTEKWIRTIRDVDIILTEGYKFGPWPKLMLHREAAGKPLPLPPEQCLAVISDVPVLGAKRMFSLEDEAAVAEFLAGMLQNQKKYKFYGELSLPS